ncbi:MAG: M48 family metallopeptidase [Desulfobulbaceae bacterium]|nr:M48 family metallopeptidase [Desulfobulbaceae bacterium]
MFIYYPMPSSRFPRKLFPHALLMLCLLAAGGCEETNIQLAAEAGFDAVKAVTLSDDAVRRLSQEAAAQQDNSSRVAPPESPHARRLHRLVGQHLDQGEHRFNLKVYIEPTVNAFAMADGSIRLYSGLMEMMTEDELRFVIGHEMGHVVKDHVKKKMMLAYAGRAVRKGVASQENLAGNLARSLLGDVAEQLLNAQFSQQEEREADDFGLEFLRANGYPPESAASALRKLAALGNDHSFLASHPAPGKRAERILARIANPDLQEEDIVQAVAATGKGWIARLTAWARDFSAKAAKTGEPPLATQNTGPGS